MQEIWRNIPGYDGLYSVSNFGRVMSQERTDRIGRNKKRKILIPCKSQNGYLKVSLYKNGKVKYKSIHRLVAEAFLENEQNLPCINHIDENKENNVVSNLEWCDYYYNNNYGTGHLRSAVTKGCKTILLNIEGSVELEFYSMAEASRKTGTPISSIKLSMDSKRPVAGKMWIKGME